MGLGFMFVLDEASIPSHAGERAVKSADAATAAAAPSALGQYSYEPHVVEQRLSYG